MTCIIALKYFGYSVLATLAAVGALTTALSAWLWIFLPPDQYDDDGKD